MSGFVALGGGVSSCCVAFIMNGFALWSVLNEFRNWLPIMRMLETVEEGSMFNYKLDAMLVIPFLLKKLFEIHSVAIRNVTNVVYINYYHISVHHHIHNLHNLQKICCMYKRHKQHFTIPVSASRIIIHVTRHGPYLCGRPVSPWNPGAL